MPASLADATAAEVIAHGHAEGRLIQIRTNRNVDGRTEADAAAGDPIAATVVGSPVMVGR